MSKVTEVAKIFSAYIIRPHLYPELGRKIYKNLFQRNSATQGKTEAEEWCARQSISQNEAIQKITGQKDCKSIYELYPEVLQKAKQEEENCLVKMGGAGALDLLYYASEFTEAKAVLETGVAYGWSSLAILLSLKKRGGKLYSSDMPYLSRNNDQFVGCVVPEDLKANWQLFRYADRESLPKIFQIQSKFDFVHYDSDKTYNGRMWAYPQLWDKLRSGGIFMSDDIGDNVAFMDYCVQNKRTPIVVEFDGKFAGLIIKP